MRKKIIINGNHDVHSILFLVRFRSASDLSSTMMRLHDIVILDVWSALYILLRILYTYCVQRPRRPYSRAEGLTKKKLLTLCRADWTRVDVKLTADPKAQVPNRRDVRGASVCCALYRERTLNVQSTWSRDANLVGRGSWPAPSSALLRAWCIDVMRVSPVLGQGGTDSKSQSSLVHEDLAQLDRHNIEDVNT